MKMCFYIRSSINDQVLLKWQKNADANKKCYEPIKTMGLELNPGDVLLGMKKGADSWAVSGPLAKPWGKEIALPKECFTVVNEKLNADSFEAVAASNFIEFAKKSPEENK